MVFSLSGGLLSATAVPCERCTAAERAWCVELREINRFQREKALLVTSCLADIAIAFVCLEHPELQKTTARVSYQRICVALAPRILVAFQLAHWATAPSLARTTYKCGRGACD